MHHTRHMIINYLKVAFRNQRRHKTFSFINVFGLAAAMTICLLIGLMLSDQRQQDAFQTHKDRIYRVLTGSPEFRNPYATSPFPLANELQKTEPSVQAVTHVIRGVGGDGVYKQHAVEMRGYFADPAFFNVFSFQLQAGDPNQALARPNSLVITAEMATRLFREENPIGKLIEFSDRGLNFLDQGEASSAKSWGLFTVTGVVADKNYKTHLPFDVLISAASMPALIADTLTYDSRTNWSNFYSTYTYALLKQNKSVADLNRGLAQIAKTEYVGKPDLKNTYFITQPLSAISPGILLGNEPTISLPRFVYYFLGFLAFVIMISAGFNYTNLSIARALSRSKEIGIRKVNGATRRDLISQFLIESIVTAFIAMALALILLYFIREAFIHLWANQYLHFELNGTGILYGFFLAGVIVVGLLAGFYPALHLSHIEPLKALRPSGAMGTGRLPMRKVLSVFQFVISLVFIISALLILKQSRHFLYFKYEFNPSGIVNVELESNDAEMAKRVMSHIAGVEAVSACEYIPVSGRSEGISLKAAGDTGEMKKLTSLRADEHFLTMLNLHLVAGVKPESNPYGVVINESAVRSLGFQTAGTAIGQTLITGKDSKATIYRIVAVVQDFHMGLDRSQIDPLVLINEPKDFKFLNVKIGSANIQLTLECMQKAWASFDPVHPLKYKFFDEQLAASSRGFFDMVSILGFMAFLAVTIACLGMLGMAVHTTERRRKEIGIRKTLGAPFLHIAYLLSREFGIILLIAITIAAPLSFFINNLWLRNFPNRVAFGWPTIATGIGIIVFLGGLTISLQTWRAARAKPTEAMKSDT
jgi:putative ABC transport system permease protein